MKAIKTFLTLALVLSLTVGGVGMMTHATDNGDRVYYSATVMNVKDGRDSIVTLTFDDGYIPTATLVDEMLEKYGLKATLMLYKNASNDPTKIATLNELFADGRLAPESHSSTHTQISNNANNTPEIIQREVVDSKTWLEQTFTNNDISVYAYPSSTMSDDGLAVLKQHYFAGRSGTVDFNKVQSTNPTATDLTYGGWYNPYLMRLQNHSNPDKYSTETIVSYLNKVVSEKGWFITLCHAVVEDDFEGTHINSVNADMTVSGLDTLMQRIKMYQDQGKVWCTTYGEAVKYIREFQNSTATQYSEGGVNYLNVTMAETTSEGQYLDPDKFDLPLTVRITMPSGWKSVVCTQGDNVSRGQVFYENGKAYAYVDMIPNGGIATLTNPADPTAYVSGINIGQSLSLHKDVSFNLHIPANTEINGVSALGSDLEGVTLEDGRVVYTLDGIGIDQLSRTYTLQLNFTKESGYDPYDLSVSALSYLSGLATSNEAVEAKRLAKSFLQYASKVVSAKTTGADASAIDSAAALFGDVGSTAEDTSPLGSMGRLADFLSGAELTVNEKIYYVFYFKSGFTGTIDIVTASGNSTVNVVNGYYHTKNYIIVDAGGVCDLTKEVTLTAVGSVGQTDINATGLYTLRHYVESMRAASKSTALIESLYAYALSADAYDEFLND